MAQSVKQYKDVKVSLNGQDRIVTGGDIPLILRGQPRPLRTLERGVVAVRCVIVDIVQTQKDEIVFLVGMKEISRVLRAELVKKAVA